MNIKLKISSICFLSFLYLSCGYQIKNFETVAEFQHEGFINSNIYQTLIVSQPEKDIVGHVNQRDSAYMNAKKNLSDIVAGNLAKYCINKKSTSLPGNTKISEESEAKLKEKLHKYVNYGKIIFEYYNENNSVVLGYRIKKNGLKFEIDSLSFDIK